MDFREISKNPNSGKSRDKISYTVIIILMMSSKPLVSRRRLLVVALSSLVAVSLASSSVIAAAASRAAWISSSDRMLETGCTLEAVLFTHSIASSSKSVPRMTNSSGSDVPEYRSILQQNSYFLRLLFQNNKIGSCRERIQPAGYRSASRFPLTATVIIF